MKKILSFFKCRVKRHFKFSKRFFQAICRLLFLTCLVKLCCCLEIKQSGSSLFSGQKRRVISWKRNWESHIFWANKKKKKEIIIIKIAHCSKLQLAMTKDRNCIFSSNDGMCSNLFSETSLTNYWVVTVTTLYIGTEKLLSL